MKRSLLILSLIVLFSFIYSQENDNILTSQDFQLTAQGIRYPLWQTTTPEISRYGSPKSVEYYPEGSDSSNATSMVVTLDDLLFSYNLIEKKMDYISSDSKTIQFYNLYPVGMKLVDFIELSGLALNKQFDDQYGIDIPVSFPGTGGWFMLWVTVEADMINSITMHIGYE